VGDGGIVPKHLRDGKENLLFTRFYVMKENQDLWRLSSSGRILPDSPSKGFVL
jgi:hypothetical protein